MLPLSFETLAAGCECISTLGGGDGEGNGGEPTAPLSVVHRLLLRTFNQVNPMFNMCSLQWIRHLHA